MTKWIVLASLVFPTAAMAASDMDVAASVTQCYADRDALQAKITELETQVKNLEQGPEVPEAEPEQPVAQ